MFVLKISKTKHMSQTQGWITSNERNLYCELFMMRDSYIHYILCKNIGGLRCSYPSLKPIRAVTDWVQINSASWWWPTTQSQTHKEQSTATASLAADGMAPTEPTTWSQSGITRWDRRHGDKLNPHKNYGKFCKTPSAWKNCAQVYRGGYCFSGSGRS